MCCWSAVGSNVGFLPFVHRAPLSAAPPSVLSSPSSQSGAPAVDEGEPTVPEDGEGEKCVRACVRTLKCITYLSKGESVLVVVVAERGVGLVHEAKNYKLFLPS